MDNTEREILEEEIKGIENTLDTIIGMVKSDNEKHRKLFKDHGNCITKFVNCRACLARVVEHFGIEPTPPDTDKRDWHVWLIERIDKCLEKANIQKIKERST